MGTEGAYAIASGKLVSLSEQMLVSCDHVDQGCNGGLMDKAFKWIMGNGGICKESDYPYTAATGTCTKGCSPAVTVTGHHDVPAKDEDALAAAVAIGPVSVAIEADKSAFQFYKSGSLTTLDVELHWITVFLLLDTVRSAVPTTGRLRTRGVPRGDLMATFSWPREPLPSQRTCVVSLSLPLTQLVPLLPPQVHHQDHHQDHHQVHPQDHPQDHPQHHQAHPQDQDQTTAFLRIPKRLARVNLDASGALTLNFASTHLAQQRAHSSSKLFDSFSSNILKS